MFSTVTSGAVFGISSYLMQVETDVSDGLPMFHMVGLLSTEVREAADRVRVALRNSGVTIPARRITVNFSPADIRKSGVGIDLPVAIGVLAGMGEIGQEALEGVVIAGELGLDGEVKRIRGVLPLVKKAKEEGIRVCILPEENAKEGAAISGLKIVGVRTLTEAVSYLTADAGERDHLFPPTVLSAEDLAERKNKEETADFSDIYGQEGVKRAVEIAAAGFHHLLMIGAPGAGKSMIAKRIPTILPPLTGKEALEVSSIYSVAGLLHPDQVLLTRRPFVSPHHTITQTALAGGGRIPQPGVMSLAHRGVLFLDEIAEFPQATLDVMRQPLEDRVVHIARSAGNCAYPADFMLVGALNPCPCGYYPDRGRCRCSEKEIDRYLSRISGPILDRIDLCVETPRVSVHALNGTGEAAARGETSEQIRERIIRARDMQKKRFRSTKLRFNSDMEAAHIKRYCALGSAEQALMEQIYHKMDLSARAYHRIIKVARTIADLDGSEQIGKHHITEASCYRLAGGKYWRQR